MIEVLLNNILQGATAGFIAACSGWWKTNKDIELEEINWASGIRTVSIGIGSGAVAAVCGVSIEDLDGTVYLTGVTMLVDNCIKIAQRKVIPRVLTK